MFLQRFQDLGSEKATWFPDKNVGVRRYQITSANFHQVETSRVMGGKAAASEKNIASLGPPLCGVDHGCQQIGATEKWGGRSTGCWRNSVHVQSAVWGWSGRQCLLGHQRRRQQERMKSRWHGGTMGCCLLVWRKGGCIMDFNNFLHSWSASACISVGRGFCLMFCRRELFPRL